MEYNKKAGLIAVAGLVLTTHCQADSLPTKDMYAPPQDAYILDIPEGCPQPPTLAAPSIKDFPTTTSFDSQPFRGTATGADRIVAKGGKGTAAPQRVGDGGDFCIEVPLIHDAQNTITFIALDQRGCPGQTTVKTIQHSRSKTIDGGVSTVKNVASLASVTTNPAPEEGSPDDLKDDNNTTVAVLKFWDLDVTATCDEFAWIRIDLHKIYTISQINIDWGPDMGSMYGTCFTVLATTSETASTPDPTGDWTPIVEEQKGAAEAQTRMIDPVSARSVAILLYENGGSGLTETFQVGEIQIMGRDPTVAPPPSPDHCR